MSDKTNGIAHDELTMLRQRVATLEQQLAAYADMAERQDTGAHSEQRLRIFHTLTEHAPDGFLVLDLNQKLIYANPAFRAMVGYGDEIIGMPGIAFMEANPTERMELGQQLAEQGMAHGLLTYRRKDGSTFTGNHSTFRITGDSNEVQAIVTIVRDVTAQQRQAQRIEQSEAYLRAMFGAMHDLVLVLGKDGTYLDIPPTNPDLLYRPSTDLIGKRIHDVMPAEVASQYLALINKVLESREIEQFVYSLQVPAGEIWFNATISPLNEASVLWVARDITPQRNAEAERLALQEQVIAAQQAALRELSTPIIPLTDQVVAMPLIGTIDSSRAQQVIETLLEGVTATRATTAILDITGVQVVDTQVANALLRAAQAVKLLGAQVVLTGIRPEVAQTLVGLGLDMSTIVTRSSLQSGISFALAGRSIGENGNGQRRLYA